MQSYFAEANISSYHFNLGDADLSGGLFARRELKRYPQMNPYRLDKSKITIFYAITRTKR